MTIHGPQRPGDERLLTPEALAFLGDLHRRFEPERRALLARRAERRRALQAGAELNFLPETAAVRAGDWQVEAIPPELERRWVEIVGPAEPKLMVNALNSGADLFLADLEDALSPTWTNVLDAQKALCDAVRHALRFEAPDGRTYRLNERIAALLVRPRGWHLDERHLQADGEPLSASLFDFGLYVFHNAHERLARGRAPAFYLPKLESHTEARLWNEVFVHAQAALGIPFGTFKATVLIETLPAAFEMDEILFELRAHIVGLNAGRWDYLFSAIKSVGHRKENVLPDRAQVTMTVPFLRAYTDLLVKTCHRRGAHAMGGMSAFIPSRRDPEVNARAMAKVREDKEREVGDGFDGTWVAHPDLVALARGVFETGLQGAPHQKHRLRDDVRGDAEALSTLRVPGGTITEAGLRGNIRVALEYIANWLRGIGVSAIANLMEDAATAEIARAQIWQWIRHRAATDDGAAITVERYARLRDEEKARLESVGGGRYAEAAALLDALVESETFVEFLTVPAYARLTP